MYQQELESSVARRVVGLTVESILCCFFRSFFYSSSMEVTVKTIMLMHCSFCEEN